MTLKAPFPWFGGKSKVAPLVWDRFGIVQNYVEPFAGSLAVLLGRPSEPGTETVNDLDCYLSNFWRALSSDPEGYANHPDILLRRWRFSRSSIVRLVLDGVRALKHCGKVSVTVDRIYVWFNPSARVSDLRALLDSYRYRFQIGKKVYLELPLWMFAIVTDVGLGARYSQKPRPPRPEFPLTIPDNSVCSGELVVNTNARWPFWVGEELVFQFLFRTPDDWLIQEFLFEPGRKYETETVRGFLKPG